MPEDHVNNAFWVPSSRFVREDGTPAVYPHTVTDRGKPGVIAVDGRGKRFVNEAQSYHEFVQAMFRADAIPAWLVCDRDAMWRYGLGAIRPFTRKLSPYLDGGYLKSAQSPTLLAQAIGIDAAGFEATIHRFNADAREGVDREFGKGGNAYHKYVGDAAHLPNPCLAPIESAPFYAVAVYPGDLGTSAGLVTNEHAQVLDGSGRVIAGLYACGNDMSSMMKGAYPGPGITLGPALVFGYLAARRAVAAE
jgi:succinate dehydrogenase/fumarate reductase flavoprotein subunit